MIIRMQSTGRGSPRALARIMAWACIGFVANGLASAQEHVAQPLLWNDAERPAAMVVVQPPPRSGSGRMMLPAPLLPASPAVQFAPLPSAAAEEVAPLPVAPPVLRRPAKRSLPSEFRSIGELTATAEIGTSNAQAEVTSADRPPAAVPEQEPITISSDRIWTAWAPASPLRSISVHQPLYFEDTNLERYGTTARPRLQPLGSAAHFLGSAASLPYQMALQRPEQPYQYAHPFEAGRHGYRERTRPPCNRRAALMQASVIVGLVFFLP